MLAAAFAPPPTPQNGFAVMVHRFDNGSVAMTKHPLEYRNGAPEIGAGNAFTYDDLDAVVAIVQDRHDAGFEMLPKNILGAGAKQLVWWERGGVEQMWFRSGTRSFALRVPWPSLVFRARPGALSVAALASNRRPTLRTALYHAPLFNINGSGAMCTGSVVLPSTLDIASIPRWSDALKRSFGSHVNHPHTLHIGSSKKKEGVSNKAHLVFWRQLARTKAASFPKANLVPMPGMTLERFVTPPR